MILGSYKGKHTQTHASEQQMSPRREALTLVSLPLLLAAVTGAPSTTGLRSTDPMGPLLTVLAGLAWAAVSWLLLVLALTWFARDGRRAALVLLRVLAPASVRWAARAALGLAVGTAALTTPALAAPVAPPPIDLDWTSALPTPAASPVATPLVRPAAPVRSAPVVLRRVTPKPYTVPTAGTVAVTVTVQPGDSLWAIAARALGPSAGTRQIAHSWPQWWRANTSQIGNDPDLIHPGAVLLQPATLGEP
jgi:LysM repeat protein